jgi:hypothetical protein
MVFNRKGLQMNDWEDSGPEPEGHVLSEREVAHLASVDDEFAALLEEMDESDERRTAKKTASLASDSAMVTITVNCSGGAFLSRDTAMPTMCYKHFWKNLHAQHNYGKPKGPRYGRYSRTLRGFYGLANAVEDSLNGQLDKEAMVMLQMPSAIKWDKQRKRHEHIKRNQK